VQPWGADRAVLECLVGHDFDDAVELAWPERRRARAGYGTAGDHWGVAASSLVRAQGAVHAGDISTVATMTAEILRHSEAIWYDAFVVPAMLLEACVAERRNDPGAAEDAYRRALELAGASALPTTSPSPWSDSARTRSCARTRAKPRSSVGGRWPWPRRPRRRASPRMRACSSPASWRRPATRTSPRRCMGALSSGRRRHGRAKFASCSSSCSPAAPGGGAAGPGAAGGSPRGRRRGRQPPAPSRRDGSARPRLARRATRSGCGDLSDAAGRAALVGRVAARGSSSRKKLPDRSSGEVSDCRGSGPRRGPRDRDARRRSSESVRGGRGPATRRMLDVPWQCQPRPRQPHGSRDRQRGEEATPCRSSGR
jgi:hypothetical protein